MRIGAAVQEVCYLIIWFTLCAALQPALQSQPLHASNANAADSKVD